MGEEGRGGSGKIKRGRNVGARPREAQDKQNEKQNSAVEPDKPARPAPSSASPPRWPAPPSPPSAGVRARPPCPPARHEPPAASPEKSSHASTRAPSRPAWTRGRPIGFAHAFRSWRSSSDFRSSSRESQSFCVLTRCFSCWTSFSRSLREDSCVCSRSNLEGRGRGERRIIFPSLGVGTFWPHVHSRSCPLNSFFPPNSKLYILSLPLSGEEHRHAHVHCTSMNMYMYMCTCTYTCTQSRPFTHGCTHALIYPHTLICMHTS